ncbi:MAG: hypothetical protein AAGA01_17685, partial [Cyanobacteria bacterium P01_E01_bin.43]
ARRVKRNGRPFDRSVFKEIDPLCSDVGLEDPSTVAHHIPTEAVPTFPSEVEEVLPGVTEVIA